MRWRFHHPAAGAALPGHGLQHFLAVGVVRRLVVGIVVITPAIGPRQPFGQVGRKIQRLQFDVFVHMIWRHFVHCRHQRQERFKRAPHCFGRGKPGVLPCARSRLSRCGNWLHGLPQGHGAQALVGRENIDKIGGTRTRQAGNDNRAVDHDLGNIRVALEQVLQQQAIAGVADRIIEQAGPAQRPQAPIFVKAHQPDTQALAKVTGTKVTQACCLLRSGQHRLLLHVHRRSGSNCLTLHGCQLWRTQVVNTDRGFSHQCAPCCWGPWGAVSQIRCNRRPPPVSGR